MHFACGSALLGHVLYALAYHANWLYLILIGRIVSGFGFTFWMYSKRYCSDHRIVGIRRRTTLAGWLVVGQALGFSLGPFVGGVLCVHPNGAAFTRLTNDTDTKSVSTTRCSTALRAQRGSWRASGRCFGVSLRYTLKMYLDRRPARRTALISRSRRSLPPTNQATRQTSLANPFKWRT